MGNIIDGKALAKKIKGEVTAEVQKLKSSGIDVGLAVILVGENPASQIYVRNKRKDCDECGIYSEEYKLPESTTESELIDLIRKLDDDKRINGILVQLPLPRQINEKSVIAAIVPEKDVDVFTEINTGKLMIGNYDLLPCTPAGIVELINSTGVSISGKNCVVVGRSNIVGKPVSMLLMHNNGTVTICHSKTVNLPEITKNADILVAAIGKPKFITADMIKPGAIVIDVGMDRDENGKLCGDVDFSEAIKVASFITPVPGGVGPMTRAMLMKNTLSAAKNQQI
jgi:methylenetetrahydrofolate dehydrogenase (NADP+)/methenyltetrahydrofolate cyclohydrolase